MPSKGPSESDTDHASSATNDAGAAPSGRELRLGSVAGDIDEVSDEDEAADGMCMLVYMCGVSICMCAQLAKYLSFGLVSSSFDYAILLFA